MPDLLEDESSRSSEDFSSKKRLGIRFEGDAPQEMTAEDLERINKQWERFYHTKKKVLDRFTGYDEDLVSIGLLSVRRLLCLYPHCSDGLLIKQAQYDIMASLRWGNSLDSRKHQEEREDITPTGKKFLPFSASDDSSMEDQVQYEALSSNGMLGKFERMLFDKLQYQEFWTHLTDMERKLVRYLKEEKDSKPQWYKSEYVKVARKKGKARKRLMEETKCSDRKYRQTYVSTRLKFYEHFGADEEIQQEHRWFENWKPEKSIYPCHSPGGGPSTR